MLLTLVLSLMLDIIPAGKAVLRPLQPRDSVLVADQFEFGFSLDSLEAGEAVALPDIKEICNDTLVLVRDWRIDTVSTRKQLKAGVVNIEGTVVIAPFEEGVYVLPDLPVLRVRPDGQSDTLLFEASRLEVKPLQIDTATFVINDIKGQLTYPVTAAEVLPWAGGALALGGLVALVVLVLIPLLSRKKKEEEKKDPAHTVALRELDKYRSDKFWAPEKQKQFYSGVTDALRNYIDARFGVDAPEMTTAEIFEALKARSELTPELYAELKELFERADFVKFAKATVGDKENAEVLPLGVRFVTTTYQAEIEEEAKKDVL